MPSAPSTHGASRSSNVSERLCANTRRRFPVAMALRAYARRFASHDFVMLKKVCNKFIGLKGGRSTGLLSEAELREKEEHLERERQRELEAAAHDPLGRALTARFGAAWKTFITDVPNGIDAIRGMQESWAAAGRPAPPARCGRGAARWSRWWVPRARGRPP